MGLEPSCLLTLRDEALVMGLGESAQIVASQALLFEEFIAREVAGRAFCAANSHAAGTPILLHAHCHQKAFGAVDSDTRCVAVDPELRNRNSIERSCCGMAGSFGYEAAHYQISMQMAEATLLPAVRAAPDAIVVADGTSCRHQIFDGSRREAIHVARLLDRLTADTTSQLSR